MTNKIQLPSDYLPTNYSHKYLAQTQNLGEFINRVRELKHITYNFQNDITKIKSNAYGNTTLLGIIGNKLIEDWSPSIKKYAKIAGGTYLTNAARNRDDAIENETSQLLQMCSLLINDNFVKNNITQRTKNSWKTGIRNINKKVQPETRIKHIGYLLDRLETETKDLIVEMDVTKEPEPDIIIQSLKHQHPRIYYMLTAAEKLKNHATTEEEYCHCLQSCRRAIESLVIEKTNQKTFKEGAKLIEREDRKNILTTYSYLSRYGSHINEITTGDDMVSGFRLTLTAISQFKDSSIK